MKIKTKKYENNNPKKAPAFAFVYAETGKDTEAEGRRTECKLPVPVF